MPKISILTPTHNRAVFLPKVAESLSKQAFDDFEWVIGNDGSSDESDLVINRFREDYNFPIRYIKSSLRVGKSKIDNLLMENAQGEYIIWCDSDDYFVDGALNYLSNLINQIPEDQKSEKHLILAQNIDTNGLSQTFFQNKIPQDQIYDLYQNIISEYTKGDATIVIPSFLLKDKRFLEVDFLIIESSLLDTVFYNVPSLLVTKVIKVMDRTAENSISFGHNLSYCRGSCYAIAKSIDAKRFAAMTIFSKIKTIINFWRYSIHGDVDFKTSISIWPIISKKYYYSIYPVSLLFVLRDQFLRKVKKTHIEFERNIKITEITTIDL